MPCDHCPHCAAQAKRAATIAAKRNLPLSAFAVGMRIEHAYSHHASGFPEQTAGLVIETDKPSALMLIDMGLCDVSRTHQFGRIQLWVPPAGARITAQATAASRAEARAIKAVVDAGRAASETDPDFWRPAAGEAEARREAEHLAAKARREQESAARIAQSHRDHEQRMAAFAAMTPDELADYMREALPAVG